LRIPTTSESIIDSTLQFTLTVLLTILGIIVAIAIPVVIYLKQRSRKLVSYKVLTQERLLSVSGELKDKTKIFYESKEVEDVTLYKIEICNSGNKEILEKDYIEPIGIFFGQNSKVLSSQITEVKPSHFEISATSSENKITLSKTMLNAGDSITLKTLVSKPEQYSVQGRIAGGKIEQSAPKHKSLKYAGLIAGSLLIGYLGGEVFEFLSVNWIVGLPLTLFFVYVFEMLLYHNEIAEFFKRRKERKDL
jgi:hypothetical protein